MAKNYRHGQGRLRLCNGLDVRRYVAQQISDGGLIQPGSLPRTSLIPPSCQHPAIQPSPQVFTLTEDANHAPAEVERVNQVEAKTNGQGDVAQAEVGRSAIWESEIVLHK